MCMYISMCMYNTLFECLGFSFWLPRTSITIKNK